MGYRRYKGPVNTLEQAMFAQMPVRITCEGCGHFRQMAAYNALRLLSKKRKDEGVPLWKAVEGIFRCRHCQGASVKITAPMNTAY